MKPTEIIKAIEAAKPTPRNDDASDGVSFYRTAAEAIRLRHSAKTQQQIARQSNHNEALRKAVNVEAVAGLADDGEEDAVGDVMNIQSPQTHLHFHGENEKPTAAEPPEKTAAEPPAEPARKRKRSRLLNAAIAAALIGGGASIPLAIPFIAKVINGAKKEPAEPAKPHTDTSRKYRLDLGD